MIPKTTSSGGIAFIEDREGFSATPYQDSGGVWTQGFGFTGPSIGPDSPPMTREDAESVLKGRLAQVERAIYWYAPNVSLNQNQFDALVSLVYNIGTGAFKKSTLLKYLNSGNVMGAADQFLVWDEIRGVASQGLLDRRKAERSLFLTPALVANNPPAGA